jgi:hypothetical protein
MRATCDGDSVCSPGAPSKTENNQHFCDHLLPAAINLGAVELMSSIQATQYRLNFTQVRSWPSQADAIQLSEVRMYAENGQRHPIVAMSNPMGNNPVTQGASNLIDDSTATKWCAHATLDLR